MTFIEAALLLLAEPGQPRRAEELAAIAVERGLLPDARAAANMKSALTRELKHGDASRVRRVDDDHWALAGADGAAQSQAEADAEADAGLEAQSPDDGGATVADSADALADMIEEPQREPDRDEPDDDDADDGDDDTIVGLTEVRGEPALHDEEGGEGEEEEEEEGGEGEEEEEGEGEAGVAADGAAAPSPAGAAAAALTPEGGRRRRRRGGRRRRKHRGDGVLAPESQVTGEGAAAAPMAAAATPGAAVDDDDDEPEVPEVDAEPELEPIDPASLSEEERGLLEVYGEELAPAEPGAAHAEYRDAQTADEDRVMLPEIVTRRDRFGRRRDERRGRDRDRPDRPAGHAGGGAAVAAGAPAAAREAPPADRGADDGASTRAQAPVPAPRPAIAPSGRPARNDLAGAAEIILAGANGQPINVRQIGAMLRKRHLVEGDFERDWKLLKAALLHDERVRRSRGLRARVLYRGRDAFAGATGDSATAGAEEALDRAVTALDAATAAVLRTKLCKLRLPALERVAQLLLQRAGWEDLVWVKRADRMGYAVGRLPGGAPLLVGVCAGHDPIDRRAVGELRVGVEAKGLAAGHLVGPQDLAEEAWRELAQPGRSITLQQGPAFVAAVSAAGIGVMTTAVPITRVDADFFAELVED